MTTDHQASAGRRGHLWVLLAIVVLIALPIRLYLAIDAAMLSRDCTVYIWYARHLADDPIAAMRSQSHHPLYPIMILAGHQIYEGLGALLPGLPTDPVLSWQATAMAVTFISGLAVVMAVYALACVLFDRRIGLIAALLAAVAAEFCQLSADGLTDMPFLTVFLFGTTACILGLRKQSYGFLAAAGCLSGLAYLIRPEGAEVAVCGFFAVACFASGWTWRKKLIGLAVISLSAIAIASPYMAVTGKLVQKKSIKQFIWEDEHCSFFDKGQPLLADTSGFIAASHEQAGRFFQDIFRALGRIIENWGRSLRVTFLLPVIVWLIRRRDIAGNFQGHRLVLTIVTLHLLILIALIIRFDYWELFSLRHAMILAGLSLPYSAAGIAVILDAAESRRRIWVAIILAVVLIGPTLPWMLETRYAHNLYLRQAGEWIRQTSGSSTRVMTLLNRVVYYADGEIVWPPFTTDAEEIVREVRKKKPDWLVLDDRRMLKQSPTFFEDLKKALRPGESLTEVFATTGTGKRAHHRALVYQFEAAPLTRAAP